MNLFFKTSKLVPTSKRYFHINNNSPKDPLYFAKKYNLKSNIKNYHNILYKIQNKVINEPQLLETKNIKNYVQKHLDLFYQKRSTTHSQLEFWVDSVHKLFPVKYFEKEIVSSDFLIEACFRQYEFCKKIIPVLNSNSMNDIEEWTNSYQFFLELQKRNPDDNLVPTLKEDFIWHAHMQDNLKYISNTKHFFGYPLDHNDNLSKDVFVVLQNKTKLIRNKNFHDKKDNATTTYSSCSSCAVFFENYYYESLNNNNYSSYNYYPTISKSKKEKKIDDDQFKEDNSDSALANSDNTSANSDDTSANSDDTSNSLCESSCSSCSSCSSD